MPYNLPEISSPAAGAPPTPVSPFAQPEAPEVLQAGSDSMLVDLAKAPIRGALNFGTSAYGLVDTLAMDALPDADFNFLGKSSSTAGRIVEDVTEFSLAFLPVAGAIGRAGKVAQGLKLVKAGAKASEAAGIVGRTLQNAGNLTLAGDAAASAVAGSLFYHKSEERLSNLIQKYPSLQNPVTDFLQADGTESELQNRFENGLEQAGLSFLIGGPLLLGLKAIKAARTSLLGGASVEAAEAEARKVATPEAIEAANKAVDAVPAPVAPKAQLSAHLSTDTELNDIVSNYMLRTAEENAAETNSKTRLLVAQMFENGEDKNLLAAAAQVVENQLATSRTVPDVVMLQDAADTVAGLLNTNIENVLRYFANTYGELASIKTASNIVAHARFVKTYSVAFRDAMNAALESQDEAVIAKAIEAKNNYLSIQKSFDKVRSGLGLSLRAIGKAEEGSRASKAVRSLLDMSKEELEKQFSTPGGRAELEKIIFGMGDGKTAASVAELSKFQRFMGLHHEYWINMGLLSAPKTGIANLIGNSLATVALPFEIGAGAVVNKLIGTGDNATLQAALKPYALLLQQVSDSLGFFMRSFKSGATPFETLPMGEQMLTKKYWSAEGLGIKEDASKNLYNMTNWLGEAIRLPGRTMVAMDSFFKHLNSHALAKTKLYGMAYREGLKGTEADAFVSERFKKLLEESGGFYNKDAIVRKLHGEGKELLKAGKINDLYAYIDSGLKKWQDEDGAVINFAKDYAERATFTQPLPRAGEVVGTNPDTGALVSRTYNYDGIGTKVDDLVNSHPVFKLALPFTKTPLNLLYSVGQRMLPNNSIPGLKNLHRQYFADLTSGDPLKVAMAEGRLVSGMALITSTLALAYNGKITGAGPRNDNERKTLQATGWQPYSFVIDDGSGKQTYVSFQRLDPLATFFGLAADVSEFTKRNRSVNPNDYTDLISGMAIAAANNFTNKSYLSGIDQISNVLADPDRFFDKFARTRLASYVPNFLRSAVGNFGDDPYMREARTYADSIMKSVPGGSGSVDPQRNLLGEPIERKTLAPGFDYVNPMAVSTKGNDFVLDEIARMHAAFSMPRSKQGDGLVDMMEYANQAGQSAYDRYLELTGEVKIGGKTLRQKLERLVTSKDYLSLQDDAVFAIDSPRASLVRRTIAKYRDAAMKAVRKEFRDFDQDMRVIESSKQSLKNGGRVTIDDLLPLAK